MLLKFLFSVALLGELSQLFGDVVTVALQMEYLVIRLFGNEEGLDAKFQFGID